MMDSRWGCFGKFDVFGCFLDDFAGCHHGTIYSWNLLDCQMFENQPLWTAICCGHTIVSVTCLVKSSMLVLSKPCWSLAEGASKDDLECENPHPNHSININQHVLGLIFSVSLQGHPTDGKTFSKPLRQHRPIRRASGSMIKIYEVMQAPKKLMGNHGKSDDEPWD